MPSTSTKAWRIEATDATPSRSSTCSAMSGEKGWPMTLLMMYCDVTTRSMVDCVLAEALAPNTAISDISASPIIRALAVAAVRRGLRSEFSVARLPTSPKTRR